MYQHKVTSFSWGNPEGILTQATEKLEYYEKQGYELVTVAMMSGYTVMFFKKEVSNNLLDIPDVAKHPFLGDVSVMQLGGK
jgi:hypothetical protein